MALVVNCIACWQSSIPRDLTASLGPLSDRKAAGGGVTPEGNHGCRERGDGAMPFQGSQPGFLEQQCSVPGGTGWPFRDLGPPPGLGHVGWGLAGHWDAC